jgi:hypothetical protein
LHRRFVVLKGTDTIATVRDDFPGERHPESGWVALGQTMAVVAHIKKNPKVFESGLELGAEQLVQLEINASPIDVGPPVAIVRVEKGAVRWIKTGACK